MVPGVLIAQNSDHAAPAKEFYRFLETFTPVKELDPKTGALLPHKSIEIRIAELLVDRAQPGIAKVRRQDLGKQFPITEMTKRDHDWSSGAQFMMNQLRAFDRNQSSHFR